MVEGPPPIKGGGGKVSKTECELLQSKLGNDNLPHGCMLAIINNQEKNVNMDEAHPQSWLWPKLARRSTRGYRDQPNSWTHGQVRVSFFLSNDRMIE
jgi:hypothetical protein